jgi:hypothetical protein
VDRVRYTVRPRHDQGNGAFSVFVYDAREALNVAKGMTERGVQDVEILDENGVAFDLMELERLARENPDATAS